MNSAYLILDYATLAITCSAAVVCTLSVKPYERWPAGSIHEQAGLGAQTPSPWKYLLVSIK